MQYSFNGGVISPDMFGRIDQAKYQTGVAKCKTFMSNCLAGLSIVQASATYTITRKQWAKCV